MTSWTTPPPEREDEEQHLHLPAGAHVADRRGLTAAGAVTIGLGLGVVGAIIDVSTGSGLRTVFAVCFITGSALAALLAHREDLKATIVMPPLTYMVIIGIGAIFGNSDAGGSVLKQQATEMVSSLITGAPVLYAATFLAFVIAVVRLRAARRP